MVAATSSSTKASGLGGVLVLVLGALFVAFLATGGPQGHAEEMYDDEKYLRIMGEPKPGSADGFNPNAEHNQQPTPAQAQSQGGEVFNETPETE